PNWQELSVGLRVLILARGDEACLGWHRPGLVAICAWGREIVLSGCADWFYRKHQGLLQKLAVPCLQRGGVWDLQFTVDTVRAFHLVYFSAKDLGTHKDRMTTREKTGASRGKD